MTVQRARAHPEWLALREPADAAARSSELVSVLRGQLPTDEPLVIHDLGCGTGSMARWLAPQLEGRQRWMLHDRDRELLAVAGARSPGRARDGAPVTTVTRHDDVTTLDRLGAASLVTASALLDVLTADELERIVALCVRTACPALLALSVTGRVGITPADPLDESVAEAFNAHQRRTTRAGRLLGPDAADAAVHAFARAGFQVSTRPSPWQLGAAQADLTAEWLTGWISAACQQRPELRRATSSYRRSRSADAATGRLHVTVEHVDLLAVPT